MIDLTQKVADLDVDAGDEPCGQLRRRSQYEFEYRPGATRPVSLLMLVEDGLLRDGGNETMRARRLLRIAMQLESAVPQGDSLELKFSLPAGSYATVLLRELLKN